MEQIAVAQRQLNKSNSGRSLSSRELSINNSISSTTTSGDETELVSKQNFRAIVEKWKQRASNTDLNLLINSMNNSSLTIRTTTKTKYKNKDTWHSVCIWSAKWIYF